MRTNTQIKKKKISYFRYIRSCKNIKGELSNVPQGTLIPSLILTIIALLLGIISDHLQIDYYLPFIFIYVLFLLMQVLAFVLYLTVNKKLIRLYLGDIINAISSWGIYITFIIYVIIISILIPNLLYFLILIVYIIIILIIFIMQSLSPFVNSKQILEKSYNECLSGWRDKNCLGCKLEGVFKNEE